MMRNHKKSLFHYNSIKISEHMQGACCKSPCRIASPSGTFRQLLALDELCIFLLQPHKTQNPQFPNARWCSAGPDNPTQSVSEFHFPKPHHTSLQTIHVPKSHTLLMFFPHSSHHPPNFKIIYTCRHCPLLPVVTTEEVHLLPSPTSENWRSPSLCHQVLTYSSLHICDTTPTPLIFLRPC